MITHTDAFLDRVKLKRSVRIWKLLSMVAIAIAVVAMLKSGANGPIAGGEYIARYNLEGMILDDPARVKLFNDIKENKRAKALLLSIDSPGGTAVGGETIYKQLRLISAEKPVVVVMRGMATSAAYMAAIAGDRIFSHEGSITGSVGVLMQSVEVTELAHKLGIKPITIKSGELKASPSPVEEATPEALEAIQVVIDDFFHYFLGIVKERRKLDDKTIAVIKDGRVFTGRQALELKLVDEIGGEPEAEAWLHETLHNKDIPVVEVKEETQPGEWLDKNVFSRFMGDVLNGKNHLGLMAVWQ
ncbi:signal peptide peptidase SppA [bacterium]|nr:signal peptide peptidase SppA [bacterium]